MASKEQKKLQKKKEREKRVRKQILAQREVSRQPEREKREERRKIKRIIKLKKDMGRLNVWADDVLMGMDEKTVAQLEKNANILKALEDEYQKEYAKKKELNEKLEKDGFLTLDEKLQHLHENLADQAKKLYKESCLDADVYESDKTAAKDVAEVEVIRADSGEEHGTIDKMMQEEKARFLVEDASEGIKRFKLTSPVETVNL